MKKIIIRRGFLGFPIGIAIGFTVALIISAFVIDDGLFHVASPEIIERMGNELNAVIFQTILSGIVGTGFAMASVIWEIDSWSLAKQSGVYFAIACAVMLPIAYFANWMPHSTAGVLQYVGIFVAIFIIVWLIQYFVWKSKIKKMNEGVTNIHDTK